MRKRTIIAIGLTLTEALAYAKLGDVACSFPAPGERYGTVRGLARSPAHLFVLAGRYADTVYWVAPNTGSVRGSWTRTASRSCHGLAYSAGGHLWAATDYGGIYDFDPFTGSLYRYWSDPPYDFYGLAPHCTGDGGTGTTAIFASVNRPPHYRRYGIREGRLLSSFLLEKEYPYDLAWDHRNKILWSGALENILFGYNMAGYVVVYCRTPTTYNYGLTYYGEYLWVYSHHSEYIYKLHCPAKIPVAPFSLGKIKSLFI